MQITIIIYVARQSYTTLYYTVDATQKTAIYRYFILFLKPPKLTLSKHLAQVQWHCGKKYVYFKYMQC